jgi:hypothetical protein
MISIEQIRESDPALKDLPEEELIRAREVLYGLAQLAIECYLDDKSKTKE